MLKARWTFPMTWRNEHDGSTTMVPGCTANQVSFMWHFVIIMCSYVTRRRRLYTSLLQRRCGSIIDCIESLVLTAHGRMEMQETC